MWVLFIIGVFLFSVIPLQVSAGPDEWWNENWSFRQELLLYSITSGGAAANQPIDLLLRFESPCWAENETHHSIRVVCQSNTDNLELESQLYNLVSSDQTHLISCNLVFLIPPETDGAEQYYVYYDDAKTPSPDYPDRVSIEESSYFYEPIPGYPLESSYYKITQEGTIRYVIAQEGQFLWYSTSQAVTKLIHGSTEVLPKNGAAIASFEFAYYYGDEMWQYSSTSQKILTKEILSDGNLMVCCRLLSGSTTGDLQTTAVYKYYYCPTSSERMTVHVVHEALNDCQVYAGANTDGLYASMQCGGIRSASIPDLNFGEIYPFLHFPSEQNTVETYPVDLTPEYSQEDPVFWLMQTSDDVDLGSDAWVSFDEGINGGVHALIFGSSSVVKVGAEERDGVSLKAYESNYPHLPGLDYTVASVECTRNTYEKNTAGTDLTIPKGFIAEFDAEFFSAPAGGYLTAEREAEIFRNLVLLKPSTDNDQSPDEDPMVDRFSLLVNIHTASSFPFGSALSALTGRSFPYLTVEVFRETTLVKSGTAGRIPLRGAITSEETPLKGRLSSVFHLVDFKNISLWKRFHFQQLEAGRYVIKVFKENPWVGDERRFIGVMVVDVKEDSSVHMFCAQQGTCVVSVLDQYGHGIPDVEVLLYQDAMVIAQNSTNENGAAILTAPCNRKDSYRLAIRYHGFEVTNESILLRFPRILVPVKKTVTLDQYDWTITLLDVWGLPPELELTPRLTSVAMQEPTMIVPTQATKNTYRFTDLLPATYHLQIQHKSFSLEKDITIPSSDESLVFPAEFHVSFHVLDARGSRLDGMSVELSRGGKTQKTISGSSASKFLVPPGLYLVKVISQDDVISQRLVTVVGERSVDLITNQQPIYPLLLMVLACIFIGFGVVFSIKKKEPLYVLLLLLIGMLIIALVFPWWSLQGSSENVQTSSTLYLIPLTLVSTTVTPQVIGGDLTVLPDVFPTIMMMIPILTVLAGLFTILVLVLKRRITERWHPILFFGVFVLLCCSVILYLGAMSAFTDVGVGSITGKGSIDISVPGQDVVTPISCQWGLGLGFWFYVVASLLSLSYLILIVYQKKKKRNRLL